MEWSQGFFTEARRHNCEVHFFIHNFQSERRDFIIDRIVTPRLDGVAVFLRGTDPDLPLLLRSLTKAGIPVLRVFGDGAGLDIPTVGLNNVAMGYVAASRFLKAGHRHLAVLNHGSSAYFRQRVEGFQIAASESGEARVHVIQCEKNLRGRMNAVLRLGDQIATALFATQIELLAAVYPLLQKKGLSVPENMSAIACGATFQLEGLPRPIDSFLIDFREVGRKAFQRLHQTMQGNLRERHALIQVPLRKTGSVIALSRCNIKK